MKKQSIFVFLIVLLFQCITCFGQNSPDTTRTYKVETIDGNIFIGEIVAEDSSVLIIKTDSFGEVRISQSNIKTKTRLGQVKKVGSEFWLPNPQSSRYFWAPNGYGLEKGTSYYQNIWVLYNQVSLGLIDNFSVGAGMVPLFLYGGASTPIWVVPKFSFPVIENKLNIGAGAFLGTLVGEDTGIFGLLYGVTTLGSRDNNLSLGLAYGFSKDRWLNFPIINFSCMLRAGPKGYFITENYVISAEGESVALISLGGRSIIRNVGLDYSLWMPFSSEMDSFVAMPFLVITVPIGREKQ